jgi:hypothetical protein
VHVVKEVILPFGVVVVHIFFNTLSTLNVDKAGRSLKHIGFFRKRRLSRETPSPQKRLSGRFYPITVTPAGG